MQFATRLRSSSAHYLALHKASNQHVIAEISRFRPLSFSNPVGLLCRLDVRNPANPITATCFIHIVAILMTAIMILHVRSKYTAVGEFVTWNRASKIIYVMDILGRKEIVMFFYLYAFIEFLAIFLDSGVIPTASTPYPVRRCSGRFEIDGLCIILKICSGLLLCIQG